MGLDMYLNKRTYVKNWDFQKPEEKHEVIVKKGGEVLDTIKPERITYIEEEIGYWRKANAIHNWFVKNVQGGVDECQRSYVSLEKLKELLEVVEKVLADNSLASTLLPTQSGFFFGPTHYDEWYFKDLEDTKVILEDALTSKPVSSIYYQSSW